VSDAIIRPLDIERDCQKLADLFNESEPAWPGGFTSGLPLTSENVREWMESERTLVTLVAEADNRLVGFCSFLENTPWPSGQYDSGYLDLLNVHPAYHGRSIGRRLLQATIERSVQEGWVYQTLGTWSANFKSVPAYKKTGHFWRPDTSVWMQNFIPGALQMPLARPFFDRHDWYASYVRVLEQHTDDERWEGIKVYRERWEADGESLTIWIDREARSSRSRDPQYRSTGAS
jgi:GNAT superfamily N-acetyltransferase